ncbi:NAD(P)-dependent methylenetetrahydromethanopterin dehydrogenase [Thiorhodococcus minor]|uniref:Methylenetetrahydromethanopterin dehydrogenase n=1 Tax=Thiorhodococcus minor TaxID=57489 RepID=A0A6M0K1K6_9GAMM|nr:NAD(P)-dependent methylenetetrahydromethanopterin dehydrogenase [Thiorhodococcus minor]NEV63630.1 methylenetetrahydromethanopterin dehydrogenase [Thiorhodococcus minor]
MEKPYLLHMLTAAKNLSPFDVNMAYDAGWTACTPYLQVTLDEVQGLVQDAIFSRGPKGVARTGIFLGGRDIHVANDMMEAARKAMVPPFEVSVFADPSGAFTTAAAMVACVEAQLRKAGADGLRGQRVLVFGGTGPVGTAAAMLASKAGADAAIVSHLGLAKAEETVARARSRDEVGLSAADGSSQERTQGLVAGADAVFNAAAAGVQVLTSAEVAAGARLKVACDVNAVPPEGIEGVGVMDNAVALEASPSGAVGIGALAVGNLKYRVQQGLLRQMHQAGSPQYLGLDAALEMARAHVD